MREVVDTRFLMEYFYSDEADVKQRASRKIKELVLHKEGILPTIVIGETIQNVCQKIGKDEAEICFARLMKSALKIENLTAEIAKQAGFLKSKHRDIPIGDCIIAATAIANRAGIVSDDPHFDGILETKRTWI